MNMVQAHNRKRTPVRIAFGKIIREKRLVLGLSQEKLAEKANLHTNYVGSVERGERNIAIENIYALSNALECSPKDLMPEIKIERMN
jgi:transcriptional regulator with XRE-family HTH domain